MIFLFFIVVYDVISANGQQLRRPVAVPYTGLGAYSINHADVFSFTANQASLAQLKNAGVAVYGERKFLLSELNNYTAAFGLPTQSIMDSVIIMRHNLAWHMAENWAIRLTWAPSSIITAS